MPRIQHDHQCAVIRTRKIRRGACLQGRRADHVRKTLARNQASIAIEGKRQSHALRPPAIDGEWINRRAYRDETRIRRTLLVVQIQRDNGAVCECCSHRTYLIIARLSHGYLEQSGVAREPICRDGLLCARGVNIEKLGRPHDSFRFVERHYDILGSSNKQGRSVDVNEAYARLRGIFNTGGGNQDIAFCLGYGHRPIAL